ncbi:MAG: tryptophan--tRNA ligase [Fibrobacteria bacterium]|nr:tryptophan--tRNA ligase [Fibrobacteria bacterium]
MNLRSLTGIKPTGMPHIGNWLGAIKPALELTKTYDALYFIADYHALTITPAPEAMKNDTYSVAATWLALGLDPEKAVFYKQSDIPQVFELCWLLNCFTPKGFLNRAHGYKDKLAKNKELKKDPDEGINMGFYSYPVLMAADILLFSADVVPVGHDQKQHLEFARDFATRVNNFYQVDLFKLPEPRITENSQTVVGLDGRKMSKSYDNTIPLFCTEKQLKKITNRIITNSQDVEEAKDPDKSSVFLLHKIFLDDAQAEDVKKIYTAGGMGWGKAKSMLFETLNEQLKNPREEYNRLVADTVYLDEVLKKGAEKARAIAGPFLEKARKIIGVAS